MVFARLSAGGTRRAQCLLVLKRSPLLPLRESNLPNRCRQIIIFVKRQSWEKKPYLLESNKRQKEKFPLANKIGRAFLAMMPRSPRLSKTKCELGDHESSFPFFRPTLPQPTHLRFPSRRSDAKHPKRKVEENTVSPAFTVVDAVVVGTFSELNSLRPLSSQLTFFMAQGKCFPFSAKSAFWARE